MKFKKVLALALSAMMAMSVLAGCGGGGGGVSGSLNINEVNGLLGDVGSDIRVERDNKLDDAVRDAAAEIASTGSTARADSIVSNTMKWSLSNFVGSAWNDFVNGGGVMGMTVRYGRTYVIEESRLEENSGAGILGAVNPNRGTIGKLGDVNTPEKFAAAQVLIVDGSVGQVADWTNDLVRFEYNVSAKKARTDNGTYWVIAAQVTAKIL